MIGTSFWFYWGARVLIDKTNIEIVKYTIIVLVSMLVSRALVVFIYILKRST
jgi:hypothetical protein